MAENEKQPDPELEKEQSEIRQRLIRRVVIAVGLVGAAATSLPLLDKFKSNPEVKLAPPPASDGQTTRIIPAPGKAEPPPSEPEKTAEAGPTKPAAAPADTPPAATEPDTAKPAAAPAAAPAKSAALPATGEPKTVARPSTATEEKQTPPPPVVAALPKSTPVTTLATKPVEPASHKPALVEPDKPEAPLKPQVLPAQAPKETLAPEKPAASEIPLLPRNKVAQGQGYTVQLGVFANYANAQALQQRLASKGIKAHMETRVQLGPFQDKQEAEAAYRKIKQLGLPAVLVGQ